MLLLGILVALGGAVLGYRWWSLGATHRSLEVYDRSMKQLGRAAAVCTRSKRLRIEVMPPAHVTVLPVGVAPLKPKARPAKPATQLVGERARATKQTARPPAHPKGHKEAS